jgi:hypothetical protein
MASRSLGRSRPQLALLLKLLEQSLTIFSSFPPGKAALRRKSIDGAFHQLNFHPLASPELGGGSARMLDRYNVGSLPAIIDSPVAKRDLDSYVGIYLKEEI